MKHIELSRRNFVKASALLGAVAALGLEPSTSLIDAPKAFADSGTERTKVRTCCHGCIQCCPCIGYVENGVIVKLEGDPEAPVSKGSMCLKGMAQLHTVYSPLRVLYPMKRVGDRGAANASWERISWDEAIELAADQFITSVEKYGPYGVWMGTGGGGQYVSPQGQKFPAMFGGPIQLSGGALQCFGPRRMAGSLIVGQAEPCLSMADSSVVEPFNEYNPTMEVCVIWGASPSTSQTAQSGRGMADALLENAHNMDAHTQIMSEVLKRSQQTLDVANETLERANKALCDVEQIVERAELLTYACVDAVESGSAKAVRETAAKELKLMRLELHESAKEAREAIKRAKEASREWKYRASRMGWFHSLTTAGKMVAIACVLFCTFMCIYTGWRAFPLI